MPLNFGQILIPFKATFNSVVNAAASMKASLSSLGTAVSNLNHRLSLTAGGLNAVAQTGRSSFNNFMLRTTDRVARLAGGLTSLNFVLDSLTRGSFAKFSDGLKALTEGTRIFANIAQFTTTKLGLIAAGFTGAAAALVLFISKMVEARIEATTAATEATVKAERSINSFTEQLEDAQKAADVFGDTFGQDFSKRLQITRASFESTTARIREITVELAALQAEINANTGEKRSGLILEKGALNRELSNLETRLKQIQATAGLDVALDRVGKIADRTRDITTDMSELVGHAPELAKIAELLRPGAGFDTGQQNLVTVATQKFKLAEERLKSLMQQARIIDTELTGLDRANLTPAQADRARELRSLRPDTDISAASDALLQAQRQLNAALAPERFTKAFTEPFADAIGDAFINGILDGKKGIEILADLSRNLLGNALNTVMDQFKKGMISAFQSIAGAGGEILGSALTAVIGVVAGALGQRRSSVDTFENIKNQIESSQAVRGIVAGPQSIAIAAVGDNLKRALIGVEQRLDILIQLSARALAQSAAGVPLAGTVATP
jgi:hypothetical protein